MAHDTSLCRLPDRAQTNVEATKMVPRNRSRRPITGRLTPAPRRAFSRAPISSYRSTLSLQADMTADTHTHVRVEDERLLRGHGRFMDDAAPPDHASVAFVRSPHAFARIVSVDVEEARRAPGVLAVLTAADMEAAGVGNISRHPPMTGRNGAKVVQTNRPALAGDRVLHVGQPVVAV